MSLSLSLTRGPLSDEGLDAIAATYGMIDHRYASREFCRTVFNENPFGYSYHAFVRDDDLVVGHYAVIPMRARARGAAVISGKGEALFLAESHRRSGIGTATGELPAAFALMKAVHEYALAEGLAVIHNITSPEIGVIERMLGFRALEVWLDQLHFLITLPKVHELRQLSYRALAARFLSVAQRVLLAAMRTALRITAAPAIEVNSSAHAEQHLSALAAAAAGAGTWTISRDLETLRWLRRLGRLEIVSLRGRPEHFAVMTKGNARELLLWNVPAGAVKNGLAIACALLAGSVRDRAGRVSMTRQLAAQGGSSLRLAVRILAFVPQRIPITIYAKSVDDFYLRSTNLDFTRLFHLS
jgi:GNAT superfamily N-acetyltransferase